MSGKTLPGCSKPLYVAVHEPKEVRRAKLAQQRIAKSGFRGNAGAVPGMYPPGAPVFYPNNVPQGYYPTMVPGGVPARAWATQAFPQPIPSYPQPNHLPMLRGGSRGRGGPAARGAAAPRQPSSNPRRNQMPLAEPVLGEFTLQSLSQFSFEQQKLFLGEKLYPLIGQTQPQLAGKITGMFLDSGWSIEELFSLLADEGKLREKIEDALAVLERAQAEQAAKGDHGDH